MATSSPARAGRLSNLLKVRPGEELRVALMMLYSMVGMTVITVGSTVGYTLFLSTLPVADLPFTFIVPPIATMGALVLYNRMAARVALPRLVLGAVLVMLAGVAGFHALLETSYGTDFLVLGGLFLWVYMIEILLGTQFWTFAGQIFDSREAKRLFGLITLGGTLARLLAAVTLIPLVTAIGVHNLLFVVEGGLGGCLVCAVVLDRLVPTTAAPTGAAAAPRVASLLQDVAMLGRVPLLRAISILTVLLSLTLYVVSYQFGISFQQTYGSDSQAMVAVMGELTFWICLALILMQGYLADRIMGRFGVILALAFPPLIMALSAGAILGTQGAFWAVALAWITDRVHYTISTAATNVLYLPVPPDLRARAKVLIDALFALACVVLGLGIVLLADAPSWTLPFWSLPVLVLAAAWIILLPRVRRHYLDALAENVRRRQLDPDGPAISLADDASVQMIAGILHQPDAAQVLYALELIASAPGVNWDPHVLPLLHHRAPAVRIAAIRHLGRTGNRRYARRLVPLLSGPDAGVRAAAIETYCALGQAAAIPAVIGFLQDPNPQVAGAAILGLLKHGGAQGQQHAAAPLGRLVVGGPESRLAAARILGALGRPAYHTLLTPLLTDLHLGVQTAAIAAAGELASPELVPLLGHLLGERPTMAAATAALLRYGPGIEPSLEAVLADPAEAPEARAGVAAALGRLGTRTAAAILLDHRHEPQEVILGAVYAALARLYGAADFAADVDTIRAAFDAEIRAAYALTLLRADLGAEEEGSILDRALAERQGRVLDHIFWLLAVRYPGQALESARPALDETDSARRAQALELLDTLLDYEMKDLLLPLLEGAPESVVEIAHRRLDLVSRSPDTRLIELARDPDPWLRACALFRIGILERSRLAPEVSKSLDFPDPLVQETAAGTLRRLRPPAPPEARPPPLSTIERVAFLRGVDLFGAVASEILVQVAGITQEVRFPAGETFIRQGEGSDYLCIIVDGKVGVMVRGVGEVARYTSRAAIGEMAIITGKPRTADCRALTEVLALKVERGAFWELLNSQPNLAAGVIRMLAGRLDDAVHNLHLHGVIIPPAPPPAAPLAPALPPPAARPAIPRRLSMIEQVAFLRGVVLFEAVPSEILAQVAGITQEVRFPAGETFIRQEESSTYLCIIVEGEVSVIVAGVGEVAHYTRGAVVGEMAIITGKPRTADCRALTEVLALKVEHGAFWELLHSQPSLAQGVVHMLAGRLDDAVHNLLVHGVTLTRPRPPVPAARAPADQ